MGVGLKAFLIRHRVRLLISGLVLAVLFGNQGFRNLARTWLELRYLRREIVALERNQELLDRRLADIHGSDLALEKEARRLGLGRPGEIEYRFTPPATVHVLFWTSSLDCMAPAGINSRRSSRLNLSIKLVERSLHGLFAHF